MRLVVDTNIMVRALLTPGPARTFFLVAPRKHVIVYHKEQLLELRDVAARPRLGLGPRVVDELISRIDFYGESVESSLEPTGECRDANDDYLLSLALDGSADIILTEDQDLLVLDPWRGIRILRLFQFLEAHPLQEGE